MLRNPVLKRSVSSISFGLLALAGLQVPVRSPIGPLIPDGAAGISRPGEGVDPCFALLFSSKGPNT
jgi:hypothetical protein